MSIYLNNFNKYISKNYSVIPSYNKVPIIEDWTTYSERPPTQDEVYTWAADIPDKLNKADIDLMLGQVSRVIALDLDCTDDRILEAIEDLLPESPCAKVGSKGWTRFFKYTGEVNDMLKFNGKVVIELLSSGKKTTIPPSIHPNGRAYRWIGTPLLEIDKKSLPALDPYLLERLHDRLEQSGIEVDLSAGSVGRNSDLTARAAELIASRYPIDKAVHELLKLDRQNHKEPLFEDSDELKLASPSINAAAFYVNHLRSINIKRQKKGEPLEEPAMQTSQVETIKEPDVVTMESFPEPTGLLKELRDFILDTSYIPQPDMALSASIVLLSTLISRKIEYCSAAPAIYCLNIAPSGSGKDRPQQAIKDLLISVDQEGLLGAGDYVSDASLTDSLGANPVRLDLIDECAGLLKAISKGERGFDSRMNDVLCELYSCSASKFLGRMTASEGRKGAVYKPGVNILGSTTIKGLKESISVAAIEKGLLGRFLIFQGQSGLPARRLKKKQAPSKELLSKLSYWATFKSPDAEGDLDGIFGQSQYEITTDDAADKLLDEYFNEFDKMRITTDSDDLLLPIISRLYQQMVKLAMVDACSSCEIGSLPVIRENNVKWAYAVITTYFNNIRDFMYVNLHESGWEESLNKVLGMIKEKGSEGLTAQQLGVKAKSIRKSLRNEILKDLTESGQVVILNKEIDKGNGKTSMQRVYVATKGVDYGVRARGR